MKTYNPARTTNKMEYSGLSVKLKVLRTAKESIRI